MAATLQTLSKDPDAVLDYVVDWTTFLSSPSDTISSVQWIVPAGITETAEIHTTMTATIWFSGGTLGKTYTITCRITTAGGRTEDHSFKILVEQH